MYIGYRTPWQKIFFNLAPADILKGGSSYDLYIAIRIFADSNQINSEGIEKYIMIGEISLDGAIQPMTGALPIAVQAKRDGFKGIILPSVKAKEAAIVTD